MSYVKGYLVTTQIFVPLDMKDRPAARKVLDAIDLIAQNGDFKPAAELGHVLDTKAKFTSRDLEALGILQKAADPMPPFDEQTQADGKIVDDVYDQADIAGAQLQSVHEVDTDGDEMLTSEDEVFASDAEDQAAISSRSRRRRG